jgi:hypothetical protein
LHVKFRLSPEEAPSVLSHTGWAIANLLTASDLESEHLGATSLAGTLRSWSFVVTAGR